MTNPAPEIAQDVLPSGPGCVECLGGASPGWWLHLRRCAACGHVGCCDNAPSQHASARRRGTGHAVIRSFEPGEDWFFDYRTGEFFDGPSWPHRAAQRAAGGWRLAAGRSCTG
jgi:Zn-finger in ubiquitin-hydrolases and other protein